MKPQLHRADNRVLDFENLSSVHRDEISYLLLLLANVNDGSRTEKAAR